MSDPIGPAPSPGQVALVSLVGTTIEWYAFQAYALAASPVFGRVALRESDARSRIDGVTEESHVSYR